MMNKKSKGEGVSSTGVLFAKNIGKAAFIFLLLLIATTFVASAQPCDHNVTCESKCCEGVGNETAGWFYYNESYYTGWGPDETPNTRLFNLSIDGAVFDAYCINPLMGLAPNDTFNASIYPAEASCKNNSIAYILNNWTHSCDQCDNVSAAQSAIWYFWFINDTFCELGEPKYNHTALPNQTGWESRWIPNSTAHQNATDMINTSINKSVPYDIGITPSAESYPAGTPIELEATVYYCDGEDLQLDVTVVFEADACNFIGGTNFYEVVTSGRKANATLICDASVDSVTVTARVKDMKWFNIIVPCAARQETIGILNITAKDAHFSFYTHRVPVLSLPFIILLAVMISLIAIAAIGRRNGKGKK